MDLTGQKFGRLTAMHETEGRNPKRPHWLCKCDCGAEAVCDAYALLRGHTKSCGCLRRDTSARAHTKHGMRHTRLYKEWQAMKERCYRKGHFYFDRYGGRGIEVCQEWRNDFLAFRDWALANGYRDDLTLDRKDNDGPYSPSNCKWSTMAEQANNRNNAIRVEHDGKAVTLKELSEIIGTPYGTLYSQYRRGLIKKMEDENIDRI